MFKTERPIVSTKEDLLGRSNTARELGRHILEYKDEDSLTIGIIGNWGSGKTSFINMCLEDIKNNKSYIIIHFNPWNISTRKQLISDFFMQLANEIKSDSEKDAEDAAIKAVKNLKFLSKFFKPVSNLNIPLVSSVATILDSAYEGAAEYLEDYIKIQEMDLDSLKKQLNNFLEKLNKKVIIVIDDIDRLSDDEIREIFQLVKSIADFKNTIYLLSYDEDIVSRALDYLQNGRGKEYLEKIVQVPIQLPYIGKEEIDSIFTNKLNDSIKILEEDFDMRYYNQIRINGFKNNFENLRDVERYINTFNFGVELAREELNMCDYMVMTLFKVFEPVLFNYIQENKEIFVGNALNEIQIEQTIKYSTEDMNKLRDNLETFFNNVKKLNVDDVRSLLLTIFPNIQRIYYESPQYFLDTPNLNKERRIASSKYFQNYFSLSFLSSQVNKDILKKIINFNSKEELKKIFSIDNSKKLKILDSLLDWIYEMNDSKQVELLHFLLSIEDDLEYEKVEKINAFLDYPKYRIDRIVSATMHNISFNKNFTLIKNMFTDQQCSLRGLSSILKQLNIEVTRYSPNYEFLSKLQELEKIFIKKLIEVSKNGNSVPRYLRDILLYLKSSEKNEESNLIFNNYLNNRKTLIPLIGSFIIPWVGLNNYKVQQSKFIVKNHINEFIKYDDLIELVDKNILNPTPGEEEIIWYLKNAKEKLHEEDLVF